MSYETLNPEETRARLDGDGQWTYVDVRTPEEFARGHVPGAYNIPAFFPGPMGMAPNPEFSGVIQAHFASDRALVLGCAAGGRSMQACEELSQAGYAQLINMDGGFSGRPDPTGGPGVPGWQERGYPVAQTAEEGRDWDSLKVTPAG
jgi:rhodanese-related sulfurtransferase